MYNDYTYEKSQNKFINKTLMYMAMGLILTFLTGFLVASSPAAVNLIYASGSRIFGLVIIELGLVVLLSRRLEKMSTATAIGMFMLYSIVNGLTFSSIFIAYRFASVIQVFVVAAAMFFCCSMIGMTVKRDLSIVGRIAIMAVVGLILTSILNIFIGSSSLSLLISYVGVIVFCALTAYDMQKVKHIHQSSYGMDPILVNKYAIISALQLYLDFVNLFIYLLRIFGDRD